jgi:hypothetical protein
MAVQGAHQRARLALRSQRGVDRPERALSGVVGADPHRRGGQLGRGPQGRLLWLTLERLGHEQDIDIADVVQLPATALAHRDHGEPALRRGVRQLTAGDLERCL